LPYAPLPQQADGTGLTAEALALPLPGRAPLKVWLVSGVRAEADVLRGEEMEWLGLVRRLPALAKAASALLILPGTHSKHLRLKQGALLGFHTVMTGELFATLSQSPTLQGCLRPGAEFGPASAAFLRGVRAAATPGFIRALFQIRARHLLDGVPPEEGTAALSGLLIGAELRQISAESRALVLAAGRLGPYYQSAAREMGMGEIEVIPGGVLDEALAWGHRQWLEAREGERRLS
jgi:2-dehydro-3-deoxygalactonokinase